MNGPIFLIVLTAFCFVVPLTQACTRSDCEFDDVRLLVTCTYRIDRRPLDGILANGTFYDTETRRRVSVAEIAPRIDHLRLQYIAGPRQVGQRHIMSIRPGTLANWTNLTRFSAESATTYEWTPLLDVPADEFVDLPRLTTIELLGMLASENTLKAIGSISDRLEHFRSASSYPSETIVSLVANFTNLTSIELRSCNTFPSLRNSASVLERIWLTDCGAIQEITREMFRAMRNLRDLSIWNTSLRSIEEGAFDDLINLEKISIGSHKMSRLPEGLFDELKRLERVDLQSYGYRIENLSRDNFTHVEDWQSLILFL